MSPRLFDPRRCTLGEGPLWHPKREQLFWFDILSHKLLSRVGDAPLEWSFDRPVSAAGWIDNDHLLIASATDLFVFNIDTGTSETLCPLEAEDDVTRSNDGRADPWGGFWIGTMGFEAKPGAGAIYRWYKGSLELLYPEITISNSICFSPDRQYAYYTDTPTKKIMRQTLRDEGWPTGPAEVFVDLNAGGYNPDGAVVDAEGCLWSAQWGANRIARYSPEGKEIGVTEFPAFQISCPAFGGPELTTLFATSAAVGLDTSGPVEGQTFALPQHISGQAEHRVLL